MSNYYTKTVVNPSIPVALMSPLERWLLEGTFSSEPDGNAIFFFAEESAASQIEIEPDNIADFLEAVATSRAICPDLCDAVVESYETIKSGIDIDAIDWCTILQSIVTRHRDVLPYLTVEQSFTCDKMRPDAFGGAAILIMPDKIESMDTNSWLGKRITANALEGGTPAPQFAIVLEGGLINSVVSDDHSVVGAHYLVVDYDAEGTTDDVRLVPQGGGAPSRGVVHTGTIEASECFKAADHSIWPVETSKRH